VHLVEPCYFDQYIYLVKQINDPEPIGGQHNAYVVAWKIYIWLLCQTMAGLMIDSLGTPVFMYSSMQPLADLCH
jgi:hypothetical protein